MADPEIVVRGRGDFSRLNRDLRSVDRGFSSLGSSIKRGLGVGLLAGGAAIGKFAFDSVQALARIERINAQTSAAIESTGGAANVTSKHVQRLATSLEDLTATEAETTQENANLLLTFTKVQNTAGRGNAIFDRAVRIFVDMQRANPAASMNQLGRALNDPVKGITALTRAGVQFNDQQRKQIERLTESGNVMAAQKVILRELTTEFGGSGEAFAKTTEGKIALAKDAFGDFGEAIMSEALPAIGRLADEATRGFNWLTEHDEQIKDFAGDVIDLGKNIGEELLPPLQDLGGVARDVLGFVSDLPDPIKDLGIQAGIAALVFPRLNTAVTAGKTSLAGYVTSVRDAETRTRALGTMARNAAGIGGMLALTRGAQETNRVMATVESTVGGALLGFSVGGPMGAAIGGVAALTKELTQLDREWSNGSKLDGGEFSSFADSLDSVTASATEATRALALHRLEQEGVISHFASFGLSSRTLVDAALGQRDAMREVAQATRGLDTAYTEGLLKTIGITRGQFRAQRQDMLREIAATRDYGKALKGLPPKVRTLIETDGIQPSVRGIARVVKQARELAPNLSRRQIKTIIEAAGVDVSVRRINQLIRRLDDVERKPRRARIDADDKPARAKVSAFENFYGNLRLPKPKLDADDAPGRRKAEDLNRLLSGLGPYNPKVDVPVPYDDAGRINQVFGNLGPWNATVFVNYVPIGNPPGGGGGGDREGKASMSPAMTVFGRGWEEAAERDGQTLLDRILKGINKGTRSDVSSGLSRLNDFLRKSIEKSIDRKNDKLEAKLERERYKALLKNLDGVYDKLRRNARAQDLINKKLEKARQQLEEVRGWVDQVKQTFIETGNITNLGVLEDGTVSIQNLLTELENERNDALRFAEIIRQLSDETGVKLNDTSLQQLLDKGPEEALAAAEALLAGGDAALDRINELTGEIAGAGHQLGAELSDEFFKNGLRTAEGIVDGLERRAKQLDRIADRFGERLEDAIRDALNGGGRGGRGAGLLELGATSARTLAPAAVVATAPQTFRFEFSASVMDQIRSGKRAVAEVDVADSVGVRKLAVTVG